MADDHHAIEINFPPSSKSGGGDEHPDQGRAWKRRRSSSVPNLRLFIADEKKKNKKNNVLNKYKVETLHAESLYSVISVLYAVFLIVVGASIPIAELFAKNTDLSFGNIEAFYVYLFVVSISFLIFVQLFVIQNQTNVLVRAYRTIVARFTATSPEKDSHQGAPPSTTPAVLVAAAAAAAVATGGRLEQENKAMSLDAHAHTGGFFLRLGAVGFGIGAMILEGLHFGEYLENDPKLECAGLAEVVRPLLQMIFILSQTYFIFRNSKMVIHRFRVIARFGMMHMVATNLCIWLRVIAIETMHELDHQNHGSGHGGHDNHHSDGGHHDNHHASDHGNSSRHHRASYDAVEPMVNLTSGGGHGSGCGHGSVGLLSAGLNDVRPYLFACTVEYSLISAGVMYLMWCNIGPRNTPSHGSHGGGSSGHAATAAAAGNGHHQHHQTKPVQRIRMDWTGTNRGLFLGILVLTVTIVSMIVFFNLVARHDDRLHDMAISLMLATLLFIDITSAAAVCGGANKFRDLSFHRNLENNLDQILLLVALVGVYLFNVFSSIAAAYRLQTPTGGLSLVASIVTLFQATVQTLFILDGLRRSAANHEQEKTKPGRQFVTFLLVSNTAYWGMNSFEVLHAGSHPVAMGFFGAMPWSIITHVTVPLAIFYRYHSTVCLADIWKDAYKLKSQHGHH